MPMDWAVERVILLPPEQSNRTAEWPGWLLYLLSRFGLLPVRPAPKVALGWSLRLSSPTGPDTTSAPMSALNVSTD
jgi:hypothetical protein